MIHIHAAIDIQSSPAEAFALLCDPDRKARLNPGAELLHVALLTPGPLATGSRVFYRLRTGQGVHEFHCTVSALEPNHIIEWVSDTLPAFRVRQVVEATPSGCRLSHDEWLESAATATAPAPRKWSVFALVEAFQQAAGLGMTIQSPDTEQREALQRGLHNWLENIRCYLEPSRDESGGDLDAITTIAF